MGENGNGKQVINPLASRCVECGRLIQSGSLCPVCAKTKKLSEENKNLKQNLEQIQSEMKYLKEKQEMFKEPKSKIMEKKDDPQNIEDGKYLLDTEY